MCPDTTSTTLADLQAAIDELPTIPETLTRILRLLEDPNSGARDLAEVISIDAPLSAKILRLANSPLYQKSRTLMTVQECVAVLGYRTVRQVALCVSVMSSLGAECDARSPVLDYRDLWKHCVNVGAIGRELARHLGYAEPEEVFTGGLLHDLGKLVLTIAYPDRYADVVRKRYGQARPLVAAEIDEFGFDHTAAGAALATAWNFPDGLVVMISDHHAVQPKRTDSALVGLADHLAHTLMPAVSDLGYDATQIAIEPLYAAVGLNDESVGSLTGVLHDAVAASSPLHNLD